MTEFEEKDGELVEVKPPCDHVWSMWVPYGFNPGAARDCVRCGEQQILVPHGYGDKEIKPVHVDFGELFYGVLGVIAMVICALILYAGATGKL